MEQDMLYSVNVQKNNFTNAERKYKQREGIPKPTSMIIEYLKCRVDLNYKVDSGSNVPLARFQSCGMLFYSENELFSSIL